MWAVLTTQVVALLLIQAAIIAGESCGENGGASHLTLTCQRPDGGRGVVTNEAERESAPTYEGKRMSAPTYEGKRMSAPTYEGKRMSASEAKRASGTDKLGGQEYKREKHLNEDRKRQTHKGPEGEALTERGYGDRIHSKEKKEGDIRQGKKNEGNKVRERSPGLHKDKREGDELSVAVIRNKKVKMDKNDERKHNEKHKKKKKTGENRHMEKHKDKKNKEYKPNRDKTKKNEHKNKDKANKKNKEKEKDKKPKYKRSKENKNNAGKKKYQKDKKKTAENLNQAGDEKINKGDGEMENIKNKIKENRKAKDKIQNKVPEEKVFETPETVTENEAGITERVRQEILSNVATVNHDTDAEKQVTGKTEVDDKIKTNNMTIYVEENIGSDAIYGQSQIDAEGKVSEIVVKDVEDHAKELETVALNVDEVTDGESSNEVTDDFVAAQARASFADTLFVNLEFDSSELLGEELMVGTVEENKKEQEMQNTKVKRPEVADQESGMCENGGKKEYGEVSEITETEVESGASGPESADGKTVGGDSGLPTSPEFGSQSDQGTVAADDTAKDNYQVDVIDEIGGKKGSE